MLALKNDRRVRATLMWENTRRSRIVSRPSWRRKGQNVRSRVAGSLSHGQKQWLEIGMLLAQEPKLLLVDEPVAGMTDAETLQTAELLKEINRDKTVIVVEHDMAFVRELGVKVTCMHEGSVLAEGTIDQVSTNDRVLKCIWGGEKLEIMIDLTAAPHRPCAVFLLEPRRERSPACLAEMGSARLACCAQSLANIP